MMENSAVVCSPSCILHVIGALGFHSVGKTMYMFCRLFVPSTGHNREIPPDTRCLCEKPASTISSVPIWVVKELSALTSDTYNHDLLWPNGYNYALVGSRHRAAFWDLSRA